MSELHSMEAFKALNTAVVAGKKKKPELLNEKLQSFLHKPSIQFLMSAIQSYASSRNLTFEKASLEVIQGFRELDQLWDQIIYNQNLDEIQAELMFEIQKPISQPSSGVPNTSNFLA